MGGRYGGLQGSRTVIALRGENCVVFAVEKLIASKLYEPYSNRRTYSIDQNIGIAVSGLISDARQIIETARLEAANYRAQYGTNIPLKYLNDRLSMFMHAYTLYSAVRPYGCSIVLSAYEERIPEIYMIDPSGVSYGYHGCAIGTSATVSCCGGAEPLMMLIIVTHFGLTRPIVRNYPDTMKRESVLTGTLDWAKNWVPGHCASGEVLGRIPF
ncbi:hypothetical protein QAD02_013263 [Eretmocerus hayati]|uniref:Uncharacterized protein n=1 Tax=Eretmocerus hayati TaxID=131215 RepID=A0ACC2P337_9HYME|nr:hypothetical protein QAD02_013263 [Eretmocerus hayati]